MSRVECELTIPAPWGGDKETKCGTSYGTGSLYYCDPCNDYYKRLYPQGWHYYAGDVCDHGTYVGGVGVDWMCGYCEDGLTSKTYCTEEGCPDEYFEWTRYPNQWKTIHVPNPARDSAAKQIMQLRKMVFDIQKSTGTTELLHNPSVRAEWHRLIRVNSDRYVHGVEETN
tara:strand:+ start:120 stop:629 length:510 start_codon:yes stop_codon:yes gene_type:complete